MVKRWKHSRWLILLTIIVSYISSQNIFANQHFALCIPLCTIWFWVGQLSLWFSITWPRLSVGEILVCGCKTVLYRGKSLGPCAFSCLMPAIHVLAVGLSYINSDKHCWKPGVWHSLSKQKFISTVTDHTELPMLVGGIGNIVYHQKFIQIHPHSPPLCRLANSPERTNFVELVRSASTEKSLFRSSKILWLTNGSYH